MHGKNPQPLVKTVPTLTVQVQFGDQKMFITSVSTQGVS